MSIWYNHVNPLESCVKPYSKCSIIISKIIISKQSKRRSHQAQLLITSQISSYKINLYTHGKTSDSLIRQLTNQHIISHRKIISHRSPCDINHRLKLFILYLVELERGCAKLKKLRMERSYNGVKGDVVQSSQWVDVGQSKVKVWAKSTTLIIRRWVIISNSLGQIFDSRLISSISSMIGQASRPQCTSEEMPQIKSTTQHMIYGLMTIIKIWMYDRDSKVIKVSTMRWLQIWLKNFYQWSRKWMRCEKQHCHEIDTPFITKYP